MIHLILVLALFGFATWLVLQIPMPQVVRNIIIGVICLTLVLWALQMLGVNTGFPRVKLY